MLELLRRLMAPEPSRLPDPDARLALAALLVRIARTDGLYAAEEVERIDRVLALRHGLDPFAAARLRAEAEALERRGPRHRPLHPRAEGCRRAGGPGRADGRALVVALADGLREVNEDRLMRLVANLLGLTDVDSALARQKAERA
jgi:uncharacterized tellurite resistance protein B-like protein